MLTLLIMGISTFLIGLLPTYAAIGIAAPLLLLLLRLLQGIGLGGEWGGAALMSFEYAPRERRGFFACFPQVGLAIGLCLATGVVALLSASLSEDAFQSWGWRVAFLLSIVLVIVGIFVRLRIPLVDLDRGIRADLHDPHRFALVGHGGSAPGLRLGGISVVYQVSGIVSSSITPLIATALLKANDGNPWYIATYIFIVGMISAVSAYFMRRTF